MMSDDSDFSDVGGLAAAINSRLTAEARIARAASFGWCCCGAAVALCLASLGIASALYGYSYVISIEPAEKEAASAFVHAIETAKWKTSVEGTMALAPNSEVAVAKNQSVRLQEGATVKLDKNSTIRVVGDLKINIPQPSKQQLQLDTTSKGDDLPFTDYTIFTDVPFATGNVVTGWNYDLSDTLRPKRQYCYYGQEVSKGVSARYVLAYDGTPQRPSPLAKLSFNFEEAVANCVWFSGL